MKIRIILLLAICFPSTLLAQNEKSELEKALDVLNFRSIGPAIFSGRISDFAVNPENTAEYYVAVSSGGVWKTVNHGITWEPLFDQQNSYSIGCITMDPKNPNVIWVGSGENNNQRSVGYGDGVYKSLDGGKTWKNMGLKASEHITRIIIHPENSEVIYVAAPGPLWSAGGDRGVYKSEDGGKSWNQILNISPNTGAADLVMDPQNPDILYAAVHQRRRHVFTYISGGPESALYKTTDGGKNWRKLSKGLPEVELGRIGLAISPVSPHYVYAMVEAENGQGGFFRSGNQGESWEKRNNYNTSGNYYSEIVCDPLNPDKVFAMDTWMHYTEDGGKTFKKINEKVKHVDNHAIWIDPDNTNHWLVGCDGGVYETYDHSAHWHHKPNLPVMQFYKVALDNAEPFYHVHGGTQDNFSLGGPSATLNGIGILSKDWYVTSSGDGFESQVDPRNPDIIYAQSQYGYLVRFDRKSTQMLDIRPVEGPDEEPYRWNWDAPLLISPHNPDRLYFAANKVFCSDNRGDSWQVISPDLTRQIDRNKLKVMGKIWSMDAVAKNSSTSIYGNIVALAESPVTEGLLFAGTDDGLVQVSKDGGESWTRYQKFPGVPDTTYVNFLLPSSHDSNVVYAAFNNHKRGDFKPYILKSTDQGKNWKPLMANLPERGSVYCLAEDPKDPNLIFAGTEFGVFVTLDGGKKWFPLKNGLPTIAVRDMEIQSRENDLVLATFGRGFYVLDNYSPLRNLEETLTQAAAILPVKDALVYQPKKEWGFNFNIFLGSDLYIAENPDFGATITYFLKEKPETQKDTRRAAEKKQKNLGKPIDYPSYDAIRAEDQEEEPYLVFSIKNDQGKVVNRLKSKPEQGLQRITWDLRHPSVTPVNLKPSEEYNPWGGKYEGYLAAPGMYTVEMGKFEDGVYTELAGPQSFNVTALNLESDPESDYAAVAVFKNKVADLKKSVSGMLTVMIELENRLEHIKTAIRETPELPLNLLNEYGRLNQKLDNLRILLQGDNSLARKEFPVKPSIEGRIDHLINGLWDTTSSPTQTMTGNFETAAAAFQQLKPEVQKLIDEVKQLENKLEKAGAPYTPGRF